MAITFKSHDTGNTIQMGGGKTATTGFAGPFPRYSISREDLASGDGTFINSKFSITVTGTAIIMESDSQDMLTKGQRQNRIQGEALKAAHFNRSNWPAWGPGVLTIAPYGGGANQIVFNDARITGVELPEQTEESAGVQNLEYSFTFEASQEVSAASGNTGAEAQPEQPEYLLESGEESWELSPGDTVSFQNNDVASESPYKTWTLTHTVNAVGKRKFSASGLDTDGEAWRQAVLWVGTKLKDDPNTDFIKNIMGKDGVTNFNPFFMDKDQTNVSINLESEYKAYDHVRTVSSDMASGSYSVTDTWMVSEENQPVTHEIDISLEANQDARANTVTVSGTIQGLSENNPSVNTSDKYTNAKSALATVLSKAFSAAQEVYNNSSLSGTLRSTELTKSEGHNKVTGTITFSVSFDDQTIYTTGALSEEVNVTYDNWDMTNQVVAIIGVIDNGSNGPVIQDMGTTNEKKVSVSVDITMDRQNRDDKPDGMGLALTYAPALTNLYQQSKSETWNAFTGAYNLSVSWVGTG